ncbi:hypothetical protein [Euzebya tangerina]|uniref:hypothetical protein n=1 Tax=Euzebya tangerina TaxID=591198 RepID=UPI000E30F550|nr:hypothetical protein [Euzebya tangerina]
MPTTPRSRLGDGDHHELRIHGVAGSPPDAVLDDLRLTHPTPDDCGDGGDDVTVWGRATTDRGVRAYSWGSVTSGSVSTALYLLLLPYLLTNLAGWAALPGQRSGASSLHAGGGTRPLGVRLVAAAVRLAGLGITIIFAQWALLIAVDIVAYQWGVRVRGFDPWVLGAGLLVAWAVVELQRWVTRVRLRPGAPPLRTDTETIDPVGYAWITHEQARLWDSPGTIAMQRNAHHAAALGAMAWVAVAMTTAWGEAPSTMLEAASAFLAIPLAVISLVTGIGLTVAHSLAPGRSTPPAAVVVSRFSAWVPRAAIVAAVVVVTSINLPQAMVEAGPAADGQPAQSMVFDGPVEDLSMDVVEELEEEGRPLFLPVIRDVGVALTVLSTVWLVVAGFLAFAVRDRSADRSDGWSRSRWAPFNLTGFLLLAGAVAAGMGAAGSLAVSRLLGGDRSGQVLVPGPLPEALAISFAALLLALGWMLLIGLVVQVRQVAGLAAGPGASTVEQTTNVPSDGSRRRLVIVTTAVQRLLRGGSWLMASLTAAGLIGVVLLLWLSSGAENPLVVLDGLPAVSQSIVMAALALVAGFVALGVAFLAGGRWAVVVLVVLVVAATVAVALLPSERVIGAIRPAATLIGLLGPASLIAGKGLSSIRNRSQRRTIAILWDVGTFFPRWFHPLSPPSYGDRVVTDLTALVTEELQDPQRTLILSPHSQGTVIAATAVLGLETDVDTSRLGLLTHGSPLRQFYAEFFPRLFWQPTPAALRDRLDGTRWINLLRTSDPIGAPIDLPDGPDVDRVLTDDPCARNHMVYGREPEYTQALADLQAQLG